MLKCTLRGPRKKGRHHNNVTILGGALRVLPDRDPSLNPEADPFLDPNSAPDFERILGPSTVHEHDWDHDSDVDSDQCAVRSEPTLSTTTFIPGPSRQANSDVVQPPYLSRSVHHRYLGCRFGGYQTQSGPGTARRGGCLGS